MKKTLLLLLLLGGMVPVATFAQGLGVSGSKQGYYVAGGQMFGPVPIFKDPDYVMADRVMILQGLDMEWQTFTASEIDGFKIGNRSFVSTNLIYDSVRADYFLEDILNVRDSIRVFVHYRQSPDKPTYYIVGESGVLSAPIPSDEPGPLWDMISDVTDCDRQFESFPKKATNSEIKRYYDAYSKCNPNVFQRFELGVSLNIGTHFFSDFPVDITANFWAKIPIGGYWSFRPELSFLQFDTYSDKGQFGYLFNRPLLMPLMFRYSFNSITGKLIPYIEAGLHASYSRYFRPRVMFGLAAGAGCEWKIAPKHSLYLGIRVEDPTLITERQILQQYYSLSIGTTIFGK